MPKQFYLEKFWITVAGFDWWENGPTSYHTAANLVLEFRYLKSKIKCWDHVEVGNIRTKILSEKVDHLDEEEKGHDLLELELNERAKLKSDLDPSS